MTNQLSSTSATSGTALIGSDLIANILLDFQLKTRGCRGKNLGFISLRLTKAGMAELADAQR